MSKPLELNVYPSATVHGTRYFHCDGDEVSEWDADEWSHMHRLTEAELAAEYWQAMAQGRVMTEAYFLHRFATRPHYDEVTA